MTITDEKLREAVKELGELCGQYGFDQHHEALETLTFAITELETLRAAQTWQPIETAPKDGRKILLAKFGYWNDTGDAPIDTEEWRERIWDNSRRVYGLWWCISGYWSSRFKNWNDGVEPSGLNNPTHWTELMPLPTPPKKEDL